MKKHGLFKRYSTLGLLIIFVTFIGGLGGALVVTTQPSSHSLPTLAPSPHNSSQSAQDELASPVAPSTSVPHTPLQTAIPSSVPLTVQEDKAETGVVALNPTVAEAVSSEATEELPITVRVIGEPILQPPPQKPVPNAAILHFQSGTSLAEREAYLTSIGAVVQQEMTALNTVTVLLPGDTSLQSLPETALLSAVEPDYYVSAQWEFPSRDPRLAEQWALESVHLNIAWNRLPASSSPVTVAVIDSGICAAHPDLVGRVLSGYDFVQDDTDPTDVFGHGCSVSGLIAANVDNEIGIAGMAPHVNLLPLRVLDSHGLGTYSDVAAAILYAVQNDAHIINLSLGGSQPSQILQDAIVYAQQQGVIVVAAAGNANREGALYPAAYSGVYSVGSVDANQQRSSFSNYGDTVRLYAPGRDLLTISLDGSYQFVTGTSFAAPLVSAAAALHLSVGGTLPLDGSLLDLTSLSVFAPVTPTATVVAATSVPGDEVALTGWLSVMHKDPAPESGAAPEVFVFLYTDDGKTIELKNVPGHDLDYRSQYVSVSGTLTVDAQSQHLSGAESTLVVSSLETIGAQAQAVTGSKPYVNILCRFSDSTNYTPQPVSFYQNLMLGGYPSLDHYWRTMSYNTMNLAGSQTYGWFNLPHPRSYYVAADNSFLNTSALARDCTAVADSTVNFQPFFGINMMFNQALDNTARGSVAQPVTVDGMGTQYYPMTWLPVGWGATHHNMAHEMGHAFGLPHSSGPANNPFSNMNIYVAFWDVMSRSGGKQAVCLPNFGCLGPGTIAYHHDMLGWLGSRQVTVPTGSSGTYTLDRLDTPDTGVNPLMIRVPINGSSTHFYTVEVRDEFNHDQNIPDHAVIIYDVDTERNITNAGDALIVDNDTNRNVNDEGAMWRVNETFVDAANNISIKVTGTSGTGFIVQVSNNPSTPPAAPTLLTVTGTTAFSVNLSWQDNSTNESGFRIFRRIGAAAFTEIATVGANVTTFMDVSASCATTYDYRVASYNNSGQSTQSNIAPATTLVCPPTNDLPQTAYTIDPALPYSFVQTGIQSATASADEPASTCAGPAGRYYSHTVWYKWTPNVGQRIEISTVNDPTNYDTVLTLYQGTPSLLTQVACNDDYSLGRSWLSANVTAGTTYYVMIARWSPNVTGAALSVHLALRTERFRPLTGPQLVSAIIQANGSTQYDLIELAAGTTYTLVTPYQIESGLPPITSDLVVFTNGAGYAVITRGPTAPPMRFFTLMPGTYLSLSWVKLTKGRLTGPYESGGAINSAGYLELSNVEILDNEATWAGGIVSWGAVTANRVTFARNKSLNSGGGLSIEGGTANLNDSVFLGNQSGWGGGLNTWGTSTLNRVRFADNRASNAGGSLINMGTLVYESGTVNNGSAPFAAGLSNRGKATLTSVRFVYNTATYGAAIESFDSSGSSKDLSGQSFNSDESLLLSAPPPPAPGSVQGQAVGDVELTLNSVMIENNSGSYGPALRNINGLVTLNDTTIRKHSAYESAVINWNGTLIFYGGRIENNISVLSGGALLNSLGSVSISGDTLWSGNKSLVGSGGAIANYDDLTVNGANFENNEAAAHGGAILNGSSATLWMNNGWFRLNSAYYQGGAIFNAGGLEMYDSAINENTASEGGGGIANFNGRMFVGSIEFRENSTDGYGGGLWHHANTSGSYANINNSSFDYNRAYNGGGLYGIAEDLGGIRPITELGLYSNSFHYNTALESAGAVGLEYTSAVLADGCISANTTGGMVSVVNIGPMITAPNNWWGEAGGPNTIYSDTYSGAVDVTSYQVTLPPGCGVSNDHYTTAYELSSIPYTYVVNTLQADYWKGETSVPFSCVPLPSPVRNMVWWVYRPAETSQTIDLDTFGSDYDTVLAVWRLEANGTLTLVACNDDAASTEQSKVRVAMEPNKTYYIELASRTIGGGIGTLNANFVPPSNDDFNTPLTVVSRPYSSVLHNGGATTHVDDPVPSCSAPLHHTVWYRYTPTTSGNQVFTTDGSTPDTVLAVYTGSRFALTEWACSDDTEALTSRVELPVLAGWTYYILVGTKTSDGGSIRFGVPLTLGTPTLIAPSTPTTSLSRPAFTWTTVAGAARYDIQLDVNNPPTSAPIRVSTTSFTPPIVLLPRIYYWRVRAVDTQGYGSAWSPVKTLVVTTPAGQAPSRNYFQSATPVLSWSRTSGATAYEVQIDTINTFSTPDYQTITEPDVLETTTPPLSNGFYFWRVRARQPNGLWGAWSIVDSFTVDIP